MRKLFLAVLVLVSVQVFGQNPTNYLLRNTRERLISSQDDSAQVLPRYNGTPVGLRVGESERDGFIAMDTLNGRLYIRYNGAWVRLAAFSEISGNTNSNVGSAYRLAIPNTNNIKTLGANYGIILDSATSNQIGVKVDSATLAAYFLRRKDSATGTNLNGYLTRSSLPTYYPGIDDVLAVGQALTSNRAINMNGNRLTFTGGFTSSMELNFLQYYTMYVDDNAMPQLKFTNEPDYSGGSYAEWSTTGNSREAGFYMQHASLADTTPVVRMFSGGTNGNHDVESSVQVRPNNVLFYLNGAKSKNFTMYNPLRTSDTAWKALAWNSSDSTIKVMNSWPVGSGGSTSPAGNYGNLQINRNGSFDTPASDSLSYTASGGLNVKNVITANAGTATRSVVTVDGTQTLTNKRWTARVGSTTSSATPTINTDNVDIYKITAVATNITSMTSSLSGSPGDGDILEVQFTGTGSYTLAWGSSFVSTTVTLPTAITTTTLTVILQYYTTSSYGNNKWHIVNYY